MTSYVVQPKVALLKTQRRRFQLLAIALLPLAISIQAAPETPRHVILVVWDGMRPDFVTEKYTPTLDKLACDGVRFQNHHAVYPTATDVNGAAIATGCYPNKNGIMANLEYRPKINARQPVDISDPDAIRRGDEVTGGKHLLVPTFPELLRAAGKKVALVGTKSVAILFDRHNDWTVVRMRNKALTIFAGASMNSSKRDELTKLLGPFQDAPDATAKQRNDYATRALTEFLWRDGVPDFSLLWLSEPDLSEHNYAPGSPQAIAAIKNVDDNLATVLAALDAKHVRASTDIVVVSDHGFSTIRRSIDVVALLNAAGFHAFKELPESPKPGDIMVVGNAGTVLFYVQNHENALTQRLVEWLQHADFSSVIFCRDEPEGTFPLKLGKLDTAESPDVVVAMRCFGDANQFGTHGMIDADWNRKAGEGTHATLSRWDIHNTCVAVGPDFRPTSKWLFPTGNVDIAPSVLRILNVRPPLEIDGRPFTIVQKGTSEPTQVGGLEHQQRSFGQYEWHQTLEISKVQDTVYFDIGNGALMKASSGVSH